LGTLSEDEAKEIRRHLRGCGGCRADAATLDEGMAMFASAAHAVDPPPELRDRVLGTLAEEWNEQPAASRRRFVWSPARFALAASVTLLVGALAWGALAQAGATRNHRDAQAYHHFLEALGGRDVRVATLRAKPTKPFEGEAILYDSDHGQSWCLILVKDPGLAGQVRVTISTSSGRTIEFRPIEVDADGEGATWLVTSTDISSYRTVRLFGPDGQVLATGTAASREG